jgi:hypothetical protein
MKRTILAALAWLSLAAPALAQSSPGLYYGQVPTPAQWNSYFAAKQDYVAIFGLAQGGTGAALVGSAGGIVYSNAGSFGILAGTSTANQCLLSGNLAPPTWGACTGGGGGGVSSVADSGAGTMTIPTTTGAVTVALNLGHANTWTATQSFAALSASSTITFSGLSTGTQVSCLGLNGSNQIVLVASACGTASGGVQTLNSNGSLTITNPSGPTTTAVINLTNANTWTGVQSFSNGDLAMLGATSGNTKLQASATAGATIATFPANTGTVAELNFAQTWSAVQSFNSGDLALNGATSGAITLNATAVAGSNTATLPANTGNVAELNFAQTWTATQTFNGGSPSVASSRTVSWFANDSPAANTVSFGDKLYIGDAATNYPNLSGCQTGDWFTNFQATVQGPCAYIGAFSVVVENKTNNTNNNGGGMFAANTASFGSSTACNSCGSIGVMGFVLNNNTSVGHPGYAIYGECDITQNPGTGLAGCLGIEVDVGNLVGTSVPGNPSPFQQSTLVGFQDACGSGFTLVTRYHCGSAMQIVPNDQPFTVGINFLSGSVAVTSYGSLGSFARAIVLPAGYGQTWWSNSTTEVGGFEMDSSGNFYLAMSGTTIVNGVAAFSGVCTGAITVSKGLITSC